MLYDCPVFYNAMIEWLLQLAKRLFCIFDHRNNKITITRL